LAGAGLGRVINHDDTMQTMQKTTRSDSEHKEPDRRARPRPTSGARPPGVDTAPADLEELYEQLFGAPALGPSRERVFSGVYELAVERLMAAEDAVDAARSEFYRGDHPFDYSVTESAATVGGQNR
jgi:hypothetical protein